MTELERSAMTAAARVIADHLEGASNGPHWQPSRYALADLRACLSADAKRAAAAALAPAQPSADLDNLLDLTGAPR